MITPIEDALYWLEQGDEIPYDASDTWWDGDLQNPPLAVDWAHRATRGIIAYLQEREFIPEPATEIDEEIRKEIVDNLTAIIRLSLMDYS